MGVMEWTFVFVGLSFSLYLVIAWLSRVSDTKGFYVAGQGVPAMANGMATAADWMSAASFISMAGLIATMGYAGGVYLMGWTGGYVLLALLLAPYLRKFGHFTVPDFIGDRYASNTARMVAVVCAIFVSFTYVAGQMRGVGVVFSRFLEVDINIGVIIGMAIVFIYATLGGMKGITWTQVAQYWVLITAFLIPAIAISIKLTGQPVPQVGLGSELIQNGAAGGVYLLDKLDQIHADLGFASYTEPFTGKWDKLNVFCTALALMVGTAGLPHVIVRFYTVKNVRAARWSAFWALLFISMLYLTAPATAAFARYYMIQSLNGQRASVPFDAQWEVTQRPAPTEDDDDGPVQVKTLEAVTAVDGKPVVSRNDRRITTVDGQSYTIVRQGLRPIAPAEQDASQAAYQEMITVSDLPLWFFNWEKTGLILWFDDGDGKLLYSAGKENEVFRTGKLGVADLTSLQKKHQQWIDSQGAKGVDARSTLREEGLSGPDRDIIVLATPEMAELASWIIALVAAGGLAAALSTASGLLLVISSSVAHDLYYRVINPEATEARRLVVGRATIGCAVVVAGLFGIYPPGFVSQVVAFAFGLAAASFFPAIVLGIFSVRVGTIPAVAGMIVGIAFTAFYIIGTVFFDMPTWCFGIGPQGIGTVGMVLNFAVTLALTPLTPDPPRAIKDLVESIREPEGVGPALEIETAPEH